MPQAGFTRLLRQPTTIATTERRRCSKDTLLLRTNPNLHPIASTMMLGYYRQASARHSTLEKQRRTLTYPARGSRGRDRGGTVDAAARRRGVEVRHRLALRLLEEVLPTKKKDRQPTSKTPLRKPAHSKLPRMVSYSLLTTLFFSVRQSVSPRKAAMSPKA